MSSRAATVTTNELAQVLEEGGFHHYGFTELKTPVSISFYEDWLKKGYHGEMAYLDRHLPDKRDPSRLLKRAQSAIVVTVDYLPHPEPHKETLKGVRTAAYARGRDYHHFLREQLFRTIEKLKLLVPDEEFVAFTDSSPVLERDLATRAGLGWIGKNTCLLDRKHGSLFFIAEIYTTLSIPTAEIAVHDHCGTCTRCLDACPTGALIAPRTLDARLCISYLTIESRQVPPIELREKIGNWFFGCDICQTVCPWNIKTHGRETIDSLSSQSRDKLVKDLQFILKASNRELERAFIGTPLARAGGFGLKRNALIIAANERVEEARPFIEPFKDHPKLGELAEWALTKLSLS